MRYSWRTGSVIVMPKMPFRPFFAFMSEIFASMISQMGASFFSSSFTRFFRSVFCLKCSFTVSIRYSGQRPLGLFQTFLITYLKVYCLSIHLRSHSVR